MSRKPVKGSLSWWKKKLWALVSQYVRLSYADKNGMVECYTCGKRMHWKKAQAGHGFSGRGNAILYELDIIRPQCVGCNLMQGGKYDVFTYKLRKEHGDKRFEELWKQKHSDVKFTIPFIQDEIERYKRLLGDKQ